MVYGMDSYLIFLHITMELCRIAALLQTSTLTKEAHHICYAKLLNKILAVEPQPAPGAETTKNTNEGKSSRRS